MEQDIAGNRMRRAQHLYPDEPLFKSISVYVRNNIANVGKFKENDICPNLQIHKMDLSKIGLYDTFSEKKPNLLLCGSHT